MLQIHAETYVQIGQDIQSWVDPPEDTLRVTVSTSDYRAFRRFLTGIEEKCEEVGGLPVLENVIETVLSNLRNTMTYGEIARSAEKLSDCFHAELRSKRFFLVPSDKAKYNVMFNHPEKRYVYGDAVKPFVPIIEKFPAARFDVDQAGNAFAFGLSTASVYHLMRICEHGLVSLSVALGLDPKISSWETILQKIRRTIELNSSTKPENWKEDEEFYSGAAALMTNVKNTWRNPGAHIPRIYEENDARIIFNSVEALMVHLATRLSGVVDKPAETLLADPSAEAVPKS